MLLYLLFGSLPQLLEASLRIYDIRTREVVSKAEGEGAYRSSRSDSSEIYHEETSGPLGEDEGRTGVRRKNF